MPKAQKKSNKPEEEETEETMPHGAINEEEARLHIRRLDNIFDTMDSKLDENMMLGPFDQVIWECKVALSAVMLSMEEADPKVIINTVRDPTCMTIHPHMEENLQKLEELMLLTEIP